MPAASVTVLRSNPVPWLAITIRPRRITAPLLSVMVPERVASWDCDHAHFGSKASDRTKSKRILELKKRTKVPIATERRPEKKEWLGAAIMLDGTLLLKFP